MHTSVFLETFEAALHNGFLTETQVSKKQPRANLEEENLADDIIYAKASEENKLAFHWNSRWTGWITSSKGQMAGEEVG